MTKLFVGNLDETITGDDLRDEFQRFGTVSHVWVAKNPPGFAFIEFPDQRDASDAKNGMQGRMIGSCSLRVDYKRGAEPTRDLAAAAEPGSIASYGGSGGRGYGDGVQGDRFGRDVSPPRHGQEHGSYGDRSGSPHTFGHNDQRGNGFLHDRGSPPPRYAAGNGGDRNCYDRGAANGRGGYGGGRANGNGYAGGRGGYENGRGNGGRYGGNGNGGRGAFGGRSPGGGRYGDVGGGGRGYSGGNSGGRGYGGGGGGGYAGSSAPRDAGRYWEDKSYGAAPPYQQDSRGAPPNYSSYYR